MAPGFFWLKNGMDVLRPMSSNCGFRQSQVDREAHCKLIHTGLEGKPPSCAKLRLRGVLRQDAVMHGHLAGFAPPHNVRRVIHTLKADIEDAVDTAAKETLLATHTHTHCEMPISIGHDERCSTRFSPVVTQGKNFVLNKEMRPMSCCSCKKSPTSWRLERRNNQLAHQAPVRMRTDP